MIRTRSAWISTALLCGVLLAGCGSSSSTTSTTSSTPAASTQPAPASTATSTASSATTPTPTTIAPTTSTQAAATICKSTAAKASIPANLKAKVEEICHDYATGNSAKALQKGREVCTEAVEAIPGNTAAKQKALENCKKGK
jgi:glucose/arabinose dehydrogenase